METVRIDFGMRFVAAVDGPDQVSVSIPRMVDFVTVKAA